MKKLIPLSLLLIAGFQWVHAETFLVDFNTLDSSGYVGGTWNAYAEPSDVDGSTIVNNAGIGSAYTLSYSGLMQDSSNGGTLAFNNATGGPSWATTDGSLSNTSAVADYFYTSTTSQTSFTVTFGSLTPGDTANLDLWMSRQNHSQGIGYYSYSLDGGTTFSGFNVLEKDGSAATTNGWDTNNTKDQVFLAKEDGNVLARYMNINSLTIGAPGTLQVKVEDVSSDDWAALSAMQLTVIPEPSTFAMLIVAGMGLLITRQRRRR